VPHDLCFPERKNARRIFGFLLKLTPNSSPPSIAEHNAEKGRTEGRWAEARRAIE
jgi:hypothetical protein